MGTKISELIQQLQALQAELGDVPCVVNYGIGVINAGVRPIRTGANNPTRIVGSKGIPTVLIGRAR